VETIVTSRDSHAETVADTFYIRVAETTGIATWPEGHEINLYPNPNRGRFVTEGQLPRGMDIYLEIFNEQGKLVWNRKIVDTTGTFREELDLSHAGEGLYLLRARNRSGNLRRRFVIAH
jgi:hypothetical protein